MSRRFVTSAAIILGIVAVVAIGVALLQRRSASTGGPSSATRVLATLPEFALEDETGATRDLYELRGTVWVADFVFTRCGDTCPLLTRQMAGLQREFAASSSLTNVKLVSFSVDPDFDRPQVLKTYAESAGADPSRWTFLTGTRDAVRGLVREGFKLPVGDQDNPNMPIFHSQNFVVVDRQGRVRGMFNALSADGRKDLRALLANVQAEPEAASAFVPRDVAAEKWFADRQASQRASAAGITAGHDFSFADRIGASGITFRHVNSIDVGQDYRATHYDHGTAVAVADVDGDGKLDVYFANQLGRNALYRNLGGGRFEDITDRAQVAVGDRACVSAAFADVDNDGDPDLLVTSVREGNLLFRNDGHGTFADATADARVGGDGSHASGSVFFDYDGDGLLDLFVTAVGRYTKNERRPDGLWKSVGDAFAGHLHRDRYETSTLYHNLGAGRFEDVTLPSGLAQRAWSGEATAFDFEGDGRPDLYVASMQGHDELWKNLGGGRFQSQGRQVFPATPWGAMGVKVLDWNGDGRLDLFVTDMHTDMASDLLPADDGKKHDVKTMFPPRFLATDGNHVLGNALFTNQRDGRFSEDSDAANVETGWPWGPSAGDLNADGWPDLFIAAGMNFPFRYRGSDVLLNEQGRYFASAEFLLGIEPRTRRARPWFVLDCDGADATHEICQGETGPVLSDDTRSPSERGKGSARHGEVTVWAARASRSAAIFDLDGDGDLDIVTNNYGDLPQVFVSNLAERGPVHALQVRLVGQRSNRDGIGAVVSVTAGGRTQTQVNDGKSGYLAQSVMPLYFGLGSATVAESIVVRWPDGTVQTVRARHRAGTTVVIKEQ